VLATRNIGIPERAKVPIPVITNDYNQYKVRVDVADQYRSYSFTQLKCLRNWPPILYWLLDTKPRNWASGFRVDPGLDRVGLGWVRGAGVWVGSGRPSCKPG